MVLWAAAEYIVKGATAWSVGREVGLLALSKHLQLFSDRRPFPVVRLTDGRTDGWRDRWRKGRMSAGLGSRAARMDRCRGRLPIPVGAISSLFVRKRGGEGSVSLPLCSQVIGENMN